MKVSDFDYILPEELIAQAPLEKRDQSKLLVLDKESGEISFKRFYNIIDLLKSGDLLVVNETKVIPARLFAGRTPQKTDEIEIFLIKEVALNSWEVMVRPGKKVKENTEIFFQNNIFAKVVKILENGNRILKFDYNFDIKYDLFNIGKMPLPPYIKRDAKTDDEKTYQTVFAKNEGAVAAPTAGLHFTEELFDRLKLKGIEVVKITLHVGIGTFRPVKVENVSEHVMHNEYYEIDEKAAETINRAKVENRRVIAVGTTSVRTLESAVIKDRVVAQKASTDIFIYPGYTFKVIDGLITNFHLPKSTLMMLVSALAGRDNIMNAYRSAIDERFRFYSYGDAMLII
ncbi:MAG: tRNA preQ1(34) S-adenosylmethionine ribosyltransferase-isomerase QueA [Candidatus Delongbacteria bacterium]|nr:tRNA preQ1(34) S-adenosylmethionine ribosyltransferase-isomerase QueA [Candidatus Delongbacteria bacterium]MBN2834483.1 tRNA preQ1(34) S-adenosylmethionine ribosyltransferase-isomerase QueA [Candidatus Delongbacteria bacterium]